MCCVAADKQSDVSVNLWSKEYMICSWSYSFVEVLITSSRAHYRVNVNH